MCIIEPEVFEDPRGCFFETYHREKFAALGIHAVFVQENQSLTRAGVLRGLHYQLAHPQAKLCRVVSGEVFDVAVDIRRGSPTFGHRVEAVLSADNWLQFWVPEGFAHGYCTLEDDTEVQYKVSKFYSPPHERGIAWNDPALAIGWPFSVEVVTISNRDRELPRLAEQPDLFEYRA